MDWQYIALIKGRQFQKRNASPRHSVSGLGMQFCTSYCFFIEKSTEQRHALTDIALILKTFLIHYLYRIF